MSDLKDKLSLMFKTQCLAGEFDQKDLEKFAATLGENSSHEKNMCGLADALIQISFEYLKNGAGKITVDAASSMYALDSSGNKVDLTPSIIVHTWSLFTAYIIENPHIYKKATKDNFWNFMSRVYEAIKENSDNFGKCDPESIKILPELKVVE